MNKLNTRVRVACFGLILFSVAACFQSASLLGQDEDLRVFSRWFLAADAPNLLRNHLNAIAFDQLSERQKRISALRTSDDWRRRQGEVRSALVRALGPFPEKNPLNARVLRTVQGRGFRVEHVVLESRPSFFVTGSLFIPAKLHGKAAAILNVIGHTDIAYRAPSYQQLILNLVTKNFIVFAIDPIGQGERLQYFDPEQGRSLVGGSTVEHSYLGKQCFLTGGAAAGYFAWDGIRAIDYLLSRPEVDPERVGVTGISGGGTQTSYICALDERVKAAAPANYICGFQRLLESIGPQDAEQNPSQALRNGLDHGDFLEVRAPKPTLVVATTRDFFSIQGTRETVAEVKRAYEAFGQPENLSVVEDDHVHGYTKKNREAIYAFFQRHLGNPGDSVDEELAPLPMEDLRVTPPGQLIGSLGGETVFSLNKKRAEELVQRLRQSRNDLSAHIGQAPRKAKELSGFVDPGDSFGSGLVFRGRYQRSGYVIEQYFLPGEGNILLPFLLFKPEQPPSPPAILYLHPLGKSGESRPGGQIEWLVKRGYAVVAPDLAGTGELGEASDSTTFAGVLTGRSVPGIRAAEVVRLVRFLQRREDLNAKTIPAIAQGGMATPLVHAAAWEPSISKVALVESFLSFASVALNRYYHVSFADLVPNALVAYDLADLQAALAPRPLCVINPQDQLLRPAEGGLAEQELEVVRRAYSAKQASAKLALHRQKGVEEVRQLLAQWLRE